MTNPFFPPAGQPQAPAQYGQPQGYPPPPAQYGQPPAPYGQPQGPGPYGQPQGYYAPQSGYGQPVPPPAPPRVQGNLAGFDSQPTGGNGPGISWKDAQLGTTHVMAVKRDVRDSDVIQDTQPQSQGGAPKFRKDGSPLWVLTVPVYVQPDAAHPEGDATLYVRGGIRDALVEAYGGDLRPKAGDVITLTLTERKAVANAAIPKNIFRAQVQRADGSAPTPAPAPQTVPAAPAPPAEVPQWAPPGVQPAAPPAPPYQAPAQPPAVPVPTHTDQGPVAQQAQQAPQAPAQAPGQVAGLPAMDDAQRALLARLQQAQGGGQA